MSEPRSRLAQAVSEVANDFRGVKLVEQIHQRLGHSLGGHLLIVPRLRARPAVHLFSIFTNG